jgi:hypothetical protein
MIYISEAAVSSVEVRFPFAAAEVSSRQPIRPSLQQSHSLRLKTIYASRASRTTEAAWR